MKLSYRFLYGLAICTLPLSLAACGNDVPPQGEESMKEWLAAGDYKNWHCEPEEHAPRPPSPHGVNRICSNGTLSENAEDDPYPKNSAAVKELWEGGSVKGYAVYLKIKDESEGGAGWYYFEESVEGVTVAEGIGSAGSAERELCASCHQAAGKDATHSGHDFVYTQVKQQ
jgi:hypothetical protein